MSTLNPTSSPWFMPYTQLPSFTGRAKTLHDLQATLMSTRRALLTQPAYLGSLGGIGKTQTAVTFAFRNRNVYRGTFWVRGESDWTLTADFVEMARMLGWDGASKHLWSQAIHFVHSWFDQHKDWLLIIDNVEKPEKIKEWLPSGNTGHILFTSRVQTFHQMGITQPLELGELQEEEALRFLYKQTGRLDTDSLERKSAQQIVQRIGGLPLGLEWACAYVSAKEITFREYLSLLPLQADATTPLPVGMLREGLVSLFKRNVQEVEKESSLALELLRASAFFHPDWISYDLLASTGQHLGSELLPTIQGIPAEPQGLEQILGYLAQYHLIQWEQEGYRVHPFTQDLVKAGLGQDQRRLWASRIIESSHDHVPHEESEGTTIPESLLPHVFASAKLIQEGMAESRQSGYLLRHLGVLVHRQLSFTKAEPLLKSSVALLELALGVHHLDVAICLDDLGTRYLQEKKYTEADQFFKRSLIAREAKWGRHHIEIAHYLHQLGTYYDVMGKQTQAERLFSRSLEIREHTLGKTHPDLAEFLRLLACRHIQHGQFEQGDRLFARYVEISEEHVGRNHLQISQALLEFTNACAEQGRYREAEPLLKRAVAIGRKELIPQDPKLSSYILSMARVYHALGRTGQAETLYQEALHLMESTDHPDIAATLNNLGGLFHEQKKYGKAEPLLQRALAKAKSLLPSNHPHLATCLNNVAAVLVAKRKFAEADTLIAEALSIREHRGTPDDNNLLTILENYELILRKRKRSKEGAVYGARASAIRANRPPR